jgi:hypothetical protein
MLGREPDPVLVTDLAHVLEAREEVLPWLVLRQGAFADDPEALTTLKALAAAGNRPSRQRPDAPVLAPETPGLYRDAETALRDLIAQNLAGSAHADTLGAILHAHNSTLPGRPDYDFRRRIIELAPEPEPAVDAEAIDEQPQPDGAN